MKIEILKVKKITAKNVHRTSEKSKLKKLKITSKTNI